MAKGTGMRKEVKKKAKKKVCGCGSCSACR